MAGQDKSAVGHNKPAHGGSAANGGTAAPATDSRSIALAAAAQMIEHRNRLAGKADDAQKAELVLTTVGQNVDEYHQTHAKNASSLTGHWSGATADKFHTRAKKVNASLATTAQSASKGAAIVRGVAGHLDSGHTAVVRLIDEYVGKATPILDAARSVQGSGAHAALVKGVGQVVDLVRHYTAESKSHLDKVNTEMAHAARQLKALEKHVEHDGYADPKKAHHKAPAKVHKHEPPKTHGSAKGKDIVNRARKELGTTEHPPGSNKQKYGPTTYWCSLFATWVWRKAGVNIPQYAFTGDVYTWGQQHHLAYDSKHLDQVRPGDVLLFGSGPQNTTTSTHIAIVESVDGNTVHTIEGNSGDAVRRQTHTLSSGTFYGGVHPS
ncbi:CHAP domain-containing protein [Labedaea rhizosphaerae]|uniref:CHAP domain-containing protein n=1 Tax=Labedaea rhizosphaerae TaxID=598644 RepID=A0A4R6S877_LABRH|nr:CHAP domain-containing protein [Labedaea rhizosphaerae]TDP96072.1 CHAP domain-containing protein [Labedaea rhizosphaerae]